MIAAAATGMARRRYSRLGLVVVVAALAGASIAFGLGWRGNQPDHDKPATTVSSVAPRHSPTAAGPLARRQAAANRTHFPTPAVAAFAEPWLDKIGNCTTDTNNGGPQPGTGEQSRTRCTAGIITTYWISYRTLADRDRAQARYQTQAADAPKLAAGAAGPVDRRALGDSRTVHYIEYAYKVPSGKRAGQVVAAVWWSDPNQPIAGVFLSYWSEDLGSSWAPLRDLWNQHG
ncbi:hypothetical protein ACIBTZ_31870 [Micromonospora sp. NPDC049460]|uniref:hypothetical protein n=1 Tax=Micromonospora sp. NPDC049460 TaxID=3364272 RepID=UPI00379BC140